VLGDIVQDDIVTVIRKKVFYQDVL